MDMPAASPEDERPQQMRLWRSMQHIAVGTGARQRVAPEGPYILTRVANFGCEF